MEINKFTGLTPIVTTETEDASAPQPAPAPSSSTGIASAGDGFENFQPPTFDFGSLTTPTSAPGGESTPPPETVSSSSFFDLLTSDVAPAGLQNLKAPANKWDAMEFLIKESHKYPPDATAMKDQLVSLSPQMRSEVLAKLSEQGDLSRVFASMGSVRGSANPMADLMAKLTQDSKTNPQATAYLNDAYSALSSSMNGYHDDAPLARYVELTGATHSLDSIPTDLLQKMQSDALGAGKMMDLDTWRTLQATAYTKNGDPDAYPKADAEMTAKLDSIPQSDPNYVNYVARYSDWGIQKLTELSQNPQQFNSTIGNMIKTNAESLGSLMAWVCQKVSDTNQDPQSKQNLVKLMQDSANAVQNSFESGSWTEGGDELKTIQTMVQKLGDHSTSVDLLSQLPPNILLDFSMMEQGLFGDPETRVRINDAMAISKRNS